MYVRVMSMIQTMPYSNRSRVSHLSNGTIYVSYQEIGTSDQAKMHQ